MSNLFKISKIPQKPGYDSPTIYTLDTFLKEPNWTEIKSKKSQNFGFYERNNKKESKRKIKKNSIRPINIEDIEQECLLETTISPELKSLQEEFEERLKIVTEIVANNVNNITIKSNEASGNSKIIDSAYYGQTPTYFKSDPLQKIHFFKESSNMSLKSLKPFKKVRFSNNVEEIISDDVPGKCYKSKIFKPTNKRSGVSY